MVDERVLGLPCSDSNERHGVICYSNIFVAFTFIVELYLGARCMA